MTFVITDKIRNGRPVILSANVPGQDADSSPRTGNPRQHGQREMSEPEKRMLCIIVKESGPLPYPLKPLKMAFGPDEQVYDIPEEDKAKVFEELWPFAPCPALDDLRFDLHEQKVFKFREAQVIRHNGRNLVVSPFYSRSGGMAVDFLPPECADGESQTCVQAIKR